MNFDSSANHNQEHVVEEAGLIEETECLILFEEDINKRNISVTSCSIPTCANSTFSEGDLKTQSVHSNTRFDESKWDY
jgi:hypothetical protein